MSDSGALLLVAVGACSSATTASPPGVVARRSICQLVQSPPIIVTRDGQLISNLIIHSNGEPAISVDGHRAVRIENVRIEHRGSSGIRFTSADDLRIENVSVELVGDEVTLPEWVNIVGVSSNNVVMTNIRVSRGAAGIYLVDSPGSRMTSVEVHDFRGPFPRGQLLQWNRSDRGSLEDFSVVNDETARPQDNINVYDSAGALIRRGLLVGNNSEAGVGVMIEGAASSATVEDVDAIKMGNGCFSAVGARAVFRRTRCRDNRCDDQGRGRPVSGGLMWAGSDHQGGACCQIEASSYFHPCNPTNVYWPQNAFKHLDLVSADFSPRLPIRASFCWDGTGR
jgi:hypothetical protein